MLPGTNQQRSSIFLYINHIQPTIPQIIRFDKGLTLETSAFESLYCGQFTLNYVCKRLSKREVFLGTKILGFKEQVMPNNKDMLIF